LGEHVFLAVLGRLVGEDFVVDHLVELGDVVAQGGARFAEVALRLGGSLDGFIDILGELVIGLVDFVDQRLEAGDVISLALARQRVAGHDFLDAIAKLIGAGFGGVLKSVDLGLGAGVGLDADVGGFQFGGDQSYLESGVVDVGLQDVGFFALLGA